MLIKNLCEQFRTDEPLARHTAARLGGTADGMLRVTNQEELLWAVKWVCQYKIPWLLLGGGANVLISDKGFRGLVIVNRANNSLIDSDSGMVRTDSGVNLSTLARQCITRGLKGLEWSVSIPGTVGGAVINNAGAHGGDIAGILQEARVLVLNPEPKVQTWQLQNFEYQYRHSKIKGTRGQYVVMDATFKLATGHNPDDLHQLAGGFVAHRKKTQPPGASLGSMFKNPPGDYAGRLIEAAGLKGHQIGGVQISPVHANFFVNTGDGTATDYSLLIDLVQIEVKQQFGIVLELEIERLGEYSHEQDAH